MTHLSLAVITLLFYLAATIIQGMTLAGKLRPKKIGLILTGYPAVIGHAVLLYYWIDVTGGQNLTFLNMLSLVLWLIALLILLFGVRKPIENLAILIFPLAAISVALILLFPSQQIVNTQLHPKELAHILLAVVTFSVLCLAGLQAIAVAFQERHLRTRHLNLNQKLPPLETAEKLLFQIIALGFVLLSIMLISSWYFFHNNLTMPLIQKTLLALIAWIILGIILLGRYYLGWRGRKAIYGTLTGVVLIIVIYFASIL